MHLTVFLIPIAVIVFLMRLPKVASRAMVLRLLAIGLERNVALGPLVLGFAEESGWWERRKLLQLGRRLEGGFSVPEALDSLGGFVPPEISAATFTAEACGNLPETLRRLSLEWEQNSIERGRQLPIAVLYFSILCSLLAGTLGFLSIYVLPKYKAIFQDFGMELPRQVGGIPLSLDGLFVVLAWSDVAMLLVLAVLVFRGRRYFSRFFGEKGRSRCFRRGHFH
ncbi:MAG: type II secretion system F family protein [Planctomycetales bacterium]